MSATWILSLILIFKKSVKKSQLCVSFVCVCVCVLLAAELGKRKRDDNDDGLLVGVDLGLHGVQDAELLQVLLQLLVGGAGLDLLEGLCHLDLRLRLDPLDCRHFFCVL